MSKTPEKIRVNGRVYVKADKAEMSYLLERSLGLLDRLRDSLTVVKDQLDQGYVSPTEAGALLTELKYDRIMPFEDSLTYAKRAAR